jgi:hypothetical protein
MKSGLSYSIKPRLIAMQTVVLLLVLGFVYYYRSFGSTVGYDIRAPTVDTREVPAKLYNEDLAEWYNVTFLPEMVEDRELTSYLDNWSVKDDKGYYKSSRKESVYDIFGPLISTSGGIGERRFYIRKDSGIKGSAVYADEFIPK